MLVPVAMAINRSFNHKKGTIQKIQYNIVSQIRDTDTTFARIGMALYSLKLRM